MARLVAAARPESRDAAWSSRPSTGTTWQLSVDTGAALTGAPVPVVVVSRSGIDRPGLGATCDPDRLPGVM